MLGATLVATGLVLFAKKRFALFITFTLLAVTLILGALILRRVDRWRKEQATSPELSTSDQLTEFRALFDRGELSREEFERIRERLGKQIHAEVLAEQQVKENSPKPPDEDFLKGIQIDED